MRTRTIMLALLPALIAAGCMTEEEWRRLWEPKNKGAQPVADPRSVSKSKATRDIIGPLVTVDGLRMQQVRGYGVVVDLIDTGGTDGPTIVRDYLVKEIRRRTEIGGPGIAPDDILKSTDAVMVEITGLIHAGAKKEDRFDIVVRALGSQAKSLVGGRLALGELKLYAETPTGVIGGATLASASGPVFVPCFDREGKPSPKIDLKTGFVLGGGVVQKDRILRLVMNDPSYSVAQQIVTRLNGAYGGSEPVAVGQSPSYIDIHIPKPFQNYRRQFLERVLHTTRNPSISFLEQRAKDLTQEITHPDAEFDSIGLAWEAIGKIALKEVKPLYQSTLHEAAYYAGRTGLRLGDREGMEVVARFALDRHGAHRKDAIDELGLAFDMHSMYGAGEHLRKLLDEPDDQVRIRAYRALRKRPHAAITSRVLDQDNCILDVVESSAPYMIYVQRLNEPRIALFGHKMRCLPPVIFPDDRSEERRLLTMINASADSSELTVMYKNKRNGKSGELKGPLEISELITLLGDAPTNGRDEPVNGLAVPFSELVDILQTWCGTGTIPAKFVVEESADQGAETELDRERPESEF